jgi:hypothetical protein
MDFAEQERKPKQTVAPTHQSSSADGSTETPLPPGNGVNYSKVSKALQAVPKFGDVPKELQRNVSTSSGSGSAQRPITGVTVGAPTTPGNGVDYSKVSKALQAVPKFGDVPPHLQQKAQGQSNAAVPQQSQQLEPKTAQSEPMQLASAKLDAGQAQNTEPQSGTPSGEMKVAGGQIRMDPGDTKEKPQRTRAEIERLFPEDKLKRQVQEQSLKLLENNKKRLDSEQQKYTSNSNPNSKEWQSLWGAARQRQDLQTQAKDLKAQQARMSGERVKAFGLPQGSPQWKKQIDFIKRREAFLNNSIALNRQAQANLQYAFPALSAVQDQDLKTQNVQAVQQRLPGEFNGIRGNIDGLSNELKRNPGAALMFDAAVERHLVGVTDPKQRQQLQKWVEEQRASQKLPTQLLGLSSGALFLAAFFPPLAEVAGGLRLAAGVVGGTAAGLEMPDLIRMDMAAQAGRGGKPGEGQLTSQLHDEARLNLMMGWTNVVMAGIDVGLETGAIQALGRRTSWLGASGVRIGRDGWQRILKAKQQGGKQLAQVLDELKLPKAQRQELELAVEGVPNGTVDPKQPLQSTGNVRGSSRTTAPNPNVSAELAAKWSSAKNWNEVEPIIGKQAGAKLPPGYYYDKRGRIYRPRGQAKDTVPLQVAEDGTFRITTQVSNRISNARRMGLNFEKAYGKLKDGHWIHHLIPDAVVRNNPLAKLARSVGYDLDHSSNLLGLADKETWAKIRTNQLKGSSGNGYSDKVGHWSSHTNYSKQVEGYLNRQFGRLESKFGDLGKAFQDPTKAKQLKKEVEQTMKDAENHFRDLINNGKAPSTPDGRISWKNKQTEPFA